MIKKQTERYCVKTVDLINIPNPKPNLVVDVRLFS